MHMQMRGRFVVMNWILSERITGIAAPLYQGLPIGNLTGYTVNIRVRPEYTMGKDTATGQNQGGWGNSLGRAVSHRCKQET